MRSSPLPPGVLLLGPDGRVLGAGGTAAEPDVASRITAGWQGAQREQRRLFSVRGADGRPIVVVALPTQEAIALIAMQREGRDPLFEFVASVGIADDVLADFLRDMLTVVDRDGVLQYVSPVHERFFGLEPGSGIGRHVTELIENTRLHEVAATGKAEVGALHELRGVTRVVSRRPVRNKRGETVGATGHVMTTSPEQLHELAGELARLKSEVAFYRRELKDLRLRSHGLERMVGESEAMAILRKRIAKVAPLDVPVLLTGESGTGKELAAQAIHVLSGRRDAAMVMVNAAALPATLVESELFGYEAGAFTGAERRGRKGKIEQADSGTLFFDEVGDMPSDVQVKLLRVLQDGTFQRVGGNEPRRSRFRLISASNRDFDAMIAEGTFRLDLFYRIGGVTIHLPPLRERLEDIPLLAEVALAEFAERHRQRQKRLPPEAAAFLKTRSWPGNVRQLMHAVERAAIFSEQDVLGPDDFQFTDARSAQRPHEPLLEAAPAPRRVSSVVEQVKAQMIRDAMKRHRGNKKRVAAELGISRSWLYQRLARLGIGTDAQE